ncbi:MAG: hypothetical protein ACO24O_05055, partial [Arenimonas sp.]
RLRASFPDRQLMVLVVVRDATDLERAIAAGADAVVRAPFATRELEVRLRGVGIVTCDEVLSTDGTVSELRCRLDLESRPGMEGSKRKVKGTIHWVCAKHAVAAEFRLFDRLFTVENPDSDEGGSYRDYLNPESAQRTMGFVEPAAASAVPEQSFQFERQGYFVADRYDHRSDKPVFNRSVTLRDTWAAK